MSHDRLDALIAWFESLQPETLTRIDDFYAAEAAFKDPFNEVRGRAAIHKIFAHMFEQVETPRFEIDECYVEGERAMLLWRFHFVSRMPRKQFCIEGATKLVFDSQGRIESHRDYWDVAGEFYERLPVLGCLVRGLQRLGRA